MPIYIPDGVIIGHRIRDQRKLRNMTQEELAVLVGTNARQVWRWESGDNIPRADMLGAIAQALGTSADYLLGIQARFNLEHLSHEELSIIIQLRHGHKLNAIRLITQKRPYREDEEIVDDIEKGTYPDYSKLGGGDPYSED